MKKKGVTLIEALIDVAILMIVIAAVVTAYSASFKSMNYARAKLAAVAFANEKMEMVHNLSYDALATEHGAIYPPGDLLDEETSLRNGINLTVTTKITYVDDPYDGCADVGTAGTKSECLKNMLAGKPKDLYPYDYKKVEVNVSQPGKPAILASLTTNVSAKAAETPSNTGVLKICIIDSGSNPVSEATVTIANTTTDPAVNMQITTGEDGCLMIPNLPEDSHHHYHIEVSKNGYSTDKTYSWTAQNPHQIQPDQNITKQTVTEQTLVIDFLSNMKIDLADQSGAALAGRTVHITGAKQIFFQGNQKQKYSEDKVTDANGHIEIANMEFDAYTFSVNAMNLISVSPFQPVGLNAGSVQNVKLVATTVSNYLRIDSLTPGTGVMNQISFITIDGQNIANPILRISNGTNEVSATNVSVSHGDTITAEFDLQGLPTGKYDLFITQGGQTVDQINGFEVVNPT